MFMTLWNPVTLYCPPYLANPFNKKSIISSVSWVCFSLITCSSLFYLLHLSVDQTCLIIELSYWLHYTFLFEFPVKYCSNQILSQWDSLIWIIELLCIHAVTFSFSVYKNVWMNNLFHYFFRGSVHNIKTMPYFNLVFKLVKTMLEHYSMSR